MVQMNRFAEQKLRHRSREKHMDTKGESGRGWELWWDELGDWD